MLTCRAGKAPRTQYAKEQHTQHYTLCVCVCMSRTSCFLSTTHTACAGQVAHTRVCVCVCVAHTIVCVCVRERESERECVCHERHDSEAPRILHVTGETHSTVVCVCVCVFVCLFVCVCVRVCVCTTCAGETKTQHCIPQYRRNKKHETNKLKKEYKQIRRNIVFSRNIQSNTEGRGLPPKRHGMRMIDMTPHK